MLDFISCKLQFISFFLLIFQAMRSLVNKQLREKLGNKMMGPQESMEYAAKLEDKARDLKCYQALIKRHPPVLSDWFVKVNAQCTLS